MTILDEIFRHKQSEVTREKLHTSQEELQKQAEGAPRPLDFAGELRRQAAASGVPALIAEIKRRSPSKGVLIEAFDPRTLAHKYVQNGASAISVLTDQHYFGGSLEDLRLVAAQADRLPVLRKDFIFDAYQVFQARAAGADALLLIAAMLTDEQLRELSLLTDRLGMQALIEVHNREELERVLALEPRLVGINNRDLHTFKVSLATTQQLSALVPGEITLVAESGVHSAHDVRQLGEWGAQAVLVGEALVTAPNTAAKVRELAFYHQPQQAGSG